MAEKGTTEQAMELMRDLTKVRNFCVCAHIDHGKCIGGDSRFLLPTGEIITAKALFEKSKSIGKEFERKEKQIIYDIRQNNIPIFSLNKGTGKLESKPIQLAWKLSGGRLIKIKLRNGSEIETTPEHKYLTLNLKKRDFEYKTAEQLQLTDYIVCPKELKIKNNFNQKLFILEKLRKKQFYVRLGKEMGLELQDKCKIYGIKKLLEEIKPKIDKRSIYDNLNKKRYLLDNLLFLADKFGISYETII